MHTDTRLFPADQTLFPNLPSPSLAPIFFNFSRTSARKEKRGTFLHIGQKGSRGNDKCTLADKETFVLPGPEEFANFPTSRRDRLLRDRWLCNVIGRISLRRERRWNGVYNCRKTLWSIFRSRACNVPKRSSTRRRGTRSGLRIVCVSRCNFSPSFFSLSLSLSLDVEGASLPFEREVTNERRTGEKGGISWAILWALINRKVSMEMVMSTLSYGGKFRESLFSPSSSARPFLRPLRRVSAARENNRVCRRRS